MTSQAAVHVRSRFLFIALTVLAVAGCSRTSQGAEPAVTTADVSVSSSAPPATPPPSTTSEPCTSDGCQAEDAATSFIELWWYDPETGTLAGLADAADGLVTAEFATELVDGGDTAIRKLDPDVHVIVDVLAEPVEDDLIVVRISHRTVGDDPLSPDLSFVDVVNQDGQWRVAGTATR